MREERGRQEEGKSGGDNDKTRLCHATEPVVPGEMGTYVGELLQFLTVKALQALLLLRRLLHAACVDEGKGNVLQV